jgi:hypothetical protein
MSVLGLLPCVLLSGCQDADSRIPIDSMTVYSLDGMYEPKKGEKPTGEMFHGYPVLGKTGITSPKDRSAILAAIKKGIAKSDREEYKCFWPRHGVRLMQSGKTIEYLICFQCLQLDEFLDGRRSHKTTADTSAKLLDEQLRSAGVPRQKPGEE